MKGSKMLGCRLRVQRLGMKVKGEGLGSTMGEAGRKSVGFMGFVLVFKP